MSRASGGPDIETGDLLGLVESHLIQPGPMAPIDIKAGQNMIKSQQALQNIYMKQTKNKQNKEKGAEERKFELEDKMEKILGRR